MNWLFWLILVLFVFLVMWGHHRGFFKMIVGLAALVIAVIGTAIIGAPLAGRVYDSNIQVQVEKRITVFLEKHITSNIEDLVGTKQDEAIDELPLPEVLREILKRNNASDIYQKLGVSSFQAYLCRFLTRMVIYTAVYAIVFFVLLVAAHVAFFLLNIVAKLPVLHGMNSLAGAVVGLVQALVYTWFFFLVVTAFASHDWGAACLGMIRDSKFLSLLYDNNLLLQLIVKNIKFL